MNILASIHPQYCVPIADRRKQVEIRKTKPKIAVPFKVYIYETKGRMTLKAKAMTPWRNGNTLTDFYICEGRGKVIGEFVCKKITEFYPTMDLKQLTSIHFQMCEKSCVNMRDLYNYANGKILYGWRISDLVIYDKPKELSEFFRYCGDNPKCDGCEAHYYNSTECGTEDYCCSVVEGCKPITRPPQSWCYVQENDFKE